MHIKIQFKSFYKINNKPDNIKNNSKIFSHNLIYFFIFIILSKIYNKKNVNHDDVKKFMLSYFQHPTKTKKVIFLRAPYKNKLARLNIIRIEYTTTVSIKFKQKLITNNLAFVKNINTLNLSTQKIKHKKTTVTFLNNHKNNFILATFK